MNYQVEVLVTVALALSISVGPERDMILPMAYVVVVFSMLVQGLTVSKVLGNTE